MWIPNLIVSGKSQDHKIKSYFGAGVFGSQEIVLIQFEFVKIEDK